MNKTEFSFLGNCPFKSKQTVFIQTSECCKCIFSNDRHWRQGLEGLFCHSRAVRQLVERMKIGARLWNFLEKQSRYYQKQIQIAVTKFHNRWDYYYLNHIINMFFPVAKGELSQLRQSARNRHKKLAVLDRFAMHYLTLKSLPILTVKKIILFGSTTDLFSASQNIVFLIFCSVPGNWLLPGSIQQ